MTVRAFVGHSFLEKDKELVRVFTDFLDTLKGSMGDFDWVHATEPRPDGVPSKVLELIEGKNLFIGICTKNERVSKADNFQRAVFSTQLKVSSEKLDWKTSDWIIQEIGLAIGKGLKLILLIETGVRRPGGLFGDLEYISFDRDKPSDAFQNLTAMIAKVAGDFIETVKVDEGKAASAVAVVSKEKIIEEKLEEDDVVLRDIPSPDWNKKTYWIKYIIALTQNDEKKCKELNDAYFEKFGNIETYAGSAWYAKTLLGRIKFGNGSSLKDLKDFASTWQENSEVLGYLAEAYLHYKDNVNAREEFLKAARLETDTEKKILMFCEAAKLMDGQKDFGIVSEVLTLISNEKIERYALSCLGDLDSYYSAKTYKLAMLERRIQLDPSDTNTRFSLAYLHSEEKNEEIALYHYLQIPNNERDSSAWNNLGVSFRRFSMPARSTDAYRKAIDKGSTLAMANLAKIYTDAGLVGEAQKTLSDASRSEDSHANVASAQVALNAVSDNERETLEETISSCASESLFYAEVGHAIWQPAFTKIAKKWKCDQFEMKVHVDEDKFEGIATFSVASENRGLGSLFEVSNSPGKTTYRVIYEGEIRGRTIVGTRTESLLEPAPRSILGSVPNEEAFIMIICDDASQIRCKQSNKEIRFSTCE